LLGHSNIDWRRILIKLGLERAQKRARVSYACPVWTKAVWRPPSASLLMCLTCDLSQRSRSPATAVRAPTATSATRTRRCATSSSTAWTACRTCCPARRGSSTTTLAARAPGPPRAGGPTACTAREVSHSPTAGCTFWPRRGVLPARCGLYLCLPYAPHTNSDSFPSAISRLVSVAETWCASCEVRTVPMSSLWFSTSTVALRVLRDDLKGTLFLVDLNTGTWPSRFGESQMIQRSMITGSARLGPFSDCIRH
jgi:hypothetical protein